ncbi:MAG: hypothetical protein CMO01_32015 [Thalassobius sp.]|nr:hypothetical protein [Thalassovita sp.]
MKLLDKEINLKKDFPTWFNKVLGKLNLLPDRLSNGLQNITTAFTKDDNTYDLKIQMPGLKRKDIQIEIRDNYLIISAEKTSERKNKGSNWLSESYSYSSYTRTFKIPDGVDKDKIDARMKHGILTIKMKYKLLDGMKNKRMIPVA